MYLFKHGESNEVPILITVDCWGACDGTSVFDHYCFPYCPKLWSRGDKGHTYNARNNSLNKINLFVRARWYNRHPIAMIAMILQKSDQTWSLIDPMVFLSIFLAYRHDRTNPPEHHIFWPFVPFPAIRSHQLDHVTHYGSGIISILMTFVRLCGQLVISLQFRVK